MTYFWSYNHNCIYVGDMQPGDREATPEEIDAHLASMIPDTSAFDAACAQFRTVCGQIKDYFSLITFTGGFDEMTLVQSSPQFLTLQGQALAQAWNASDKCCTYEANKQGIGQPDWWYQCWADPNQELTEGTEE